MAGYMPTKQEQFELLKEWDTLDRRMTILKDELSDIGERMSEIEGDFDRVGTTLGDVRDEMEEALLESEDV